MRELTSHKVNGLNEALDIQVLDEPGQGGACHRYRIRCNEPVCDTDPETWDRLKANTAINFQNGPIGEVGVNGISNESLLAVVEDRLRSFQAGPYACEQNGKALEGVRIAQEWLKSRTLDRVSRGVEGTHNA